MKRLLVSLWLIAIVYVGHTPNLLQTTQEAYPTAQEPLEVRATSLLPGAAASSDSISAPRASTSEAKSGVVRLASLEPDVVRLPAPASGSNELRKTEEIQGSVPASDGEEANWVVVSRAAWVHSGPSVSAPIVYHQPIGKELRLVGYQQGWYHVSDPATSQHGWIYAKYYLEMITGPGQSRGVAQDSRPTKVALEAPKPSQPSSKVKKRPQLQVLFRTPTPPKPSESVASLLDKALRR